MPRQHTQTTNPSPQKAKPREPVAAGERDAAVNRAAGHNYFLLDKFEAGIALRGTEVKSIREGKANLKDAYGIVKDGEAYLHSHHPGVSVDDVVASTGWKLRVASEMCETLTPAPAELTAIREYDKEGFWTS